MQSEMILQNTRETLIHQCVVTRNGTRGVDTNLVGYKWEVEGVI